MPRIAYNIREKACLRRGKAARFGVGDPVVSASVFARFYGVADGYASTFRVPNENLARFSRRGAENKRHNRYFRDFSVRSEIARSLPKLSNRFQTFPNRPAHLVFPKSFIRGG